MLPKTILELIICPETGLIFAEPYVAADGLTYEKAVIEKWFEKNKTSPRTKSLLAHKNLYPSLAVKALIQEILKADNSLHEKPGAYFIVLLFKPLYESISDSDIKKFQTEIKKCSLFLNKKAPNSPLTYLAKIRAYLENASFDALMFNKPIITPETIAEFETILSETEASLNESPDKKEEIKINLENLFEEKFNCGILHEILLNPMLTPEGQLFEASEIAKWATDKKTNPSTRNPLVPDQLIFDKLTYDLITQTIIYAPNSIDMEPIRLLADSIRTFDIKRLDALLPKFKNDLLKVIDEKTGDTILHKFFLLPFELDDREIKWLENKLKNIDPKKIFEVKNTAGINPFILATQKDLRFVKLLISATNMSSIKNFLHELIAGNHIANNILKIIIQGSKINIDETNDDEETVSHIAAKNNNMEILTELIFKGASPYIKILDKNNKYNQYNAFDFLTKSNKKSLEDIIDIIKNQLHDNLKNPKLFLEMIKTYSYLMSVTFGKDNSNLLTFSLKNQADPEIINFLLNKITAKNSDILLTINNGFSSEIVKNLINSNKYPDSPDDDGNTMLHTLANNAVTIIENYDNFLDENINKYPKVINAQNKQGETPISIAINTANSKAFTILMLNFAEMHIQDALGNSPLHIAMKTNNELTQYFVSTLLEHHADIQLFNNEGYTPVYYCNNIDLLKDLFNKKIINTTTHISDKGHTLWHLAIINNNAELLKFLISNTEKEEISKLFYQKTDKDISPFDMLKSNQNEIISILTENKIIDINDKDSNGLTFLQKALKDNPPNIDLIIILVKLGVDVTAPIDDNGNFLIHYAVTFGRLELIKLLIEKDKNNISAVNNFGNTPLHIIDNSTKDNKEIYAYLLQKGAQINAVNKGKATALHNSVGHRKSEITTLLLSKNPDLNTGDIYGKTPLFIAASLNDMSTFIKLLQTGANPYLKNRDCIAKDLLSKNNQTAVDKYIESKKENLFANKDDKMFMLNLNNDKFLLYEKYNKYYSLITYVIVNNFSSKLIEELLNYIEKFEAHQNLITAQDIQIAIERHLGLEYIAKLNSLSNGIITVPSWPGDSLFHTIARLNSHFESYQKQIFEIIKDKYSEILNWHNHEGKLPLELAIDYNNFPAVIRFIDLGASPYSRLNSIQAKNPEIYKSILESLTQSKNSLLLAIQTEQISEIQKIITRYPYLLQRNYETDDYTGTVYSAILNSKKVTDILNCLWDKVSFEMHRVAGNTLLHLAVEKNLTEVVEFFIAKKSSLNVNNKFKEHPLHLAAKNGNLKLMKILIEAGADLKHFDANGNSAVFNLIKFHPELLKEFDQDIHSLTTLPPITKDHPTYLHFALTQESKQCIEILYERVNKDKLTDILESNICNDSSLIELFIKSKDEVFTFLSKNLININKKDKADLTILHHAIQLKDIEIKFIERLLDVEADDSIVMGKDKIFPVHYAAQNGLIEITKLLVNKKPANVKLADGQGNTLLHMIIKQFDPDIKKTAGNLLDFIKLLLSMNAVIDQKNDDGDTPLFSSAKADKLELLKIFLTKIEDIKLVCNKNNDTLLHIAVAYNAKKTIEYLILETKIDLAATNNWGCTAFETVNPSLAEFIYEIFNKIIQQFEKAICDHGMLHVINALLVNYPYILLDYLFKIEIPSKIAKDRNEFILQLINYRDYPLKLTLTDKNKNTLLHLAVLDSKLLSVVKFSLIKQIDPILTNKQKQTAIQLTKDEKIKKIIENVTNIRNNKLYLATDDKKMLSALNTGLNNYSAAKKGFTFFHTSSDLEDWISLQQTTIKELKETATEEITRLYREMLISAQITLALNPKDQLATNLVNKIEQLSSAPANIISNVNNLEISN